MDAQLLLKKVWGYDSFRGIQKDIIDSIIGGHDTLGLMPTGGGKSITFQVPALLQEGTCIVITPLIALMKDQVLNLRKKGIKAAAIYSGMSHDSILQTLENAIFGAIKLLYISPERLSSELFLNKLRHMKVSFLCVDEAHCISQWGYDFRPQYLNISKIRDILPEVPILALTATATPDVVDDIQNQLHFREKRVFKMSFERKNLAYVVNTTSNKPEQMIHILSQVKGSAIIYVRSRQRTLDYAKMLCDVGISATAFHAGIDDAEKDKRQKCWLNDEIRVMVATNAFGMGIDKPNVRVVIHIDCPGSIENYFQEAGRAGRDGKKAYAVLLYDDGDKAKLLRRISETFPDKDYIRQVYDHLAYFYQIAVGSGYNTSYEFPLEQFCRTYRHFPVPTISALKILNRAGYIEYKEEDDVQSRLMFCLERDDLYKLHGNDPKEDIVIEALLRNYTGLFQGYHYIDESLIAQQCNLTKPEVYEILRSLTQKRILSFIPQKHIPFIRYMQRREESEHLFFSKDVYDNLKSRYANRIEKMLEYANGNQICRSRFLLRYFGESRSHDCEICDVCLHYKQSGKEEKKEAENIIRNLLADYQPHPVKQLRTLPLSDSLLSEVLRYMVDEEIIIHQDGQITLNH